MVTVGSWTLLGISSLGLDDWNLAQLAQYMAYGIFAMGLAFIWKQAGLLSFGQAIFFGVGGYSVGLVTPGYLPLLGSSSSLLGLNVLNLGGLKLTGVLTGLPLNSLLGTALPVAVPLGSSVVGFLA